MTELTWPALLVLYSVALAVVVLALWAVVGALLKRGGMPNSPWATGGVTGLLLAVSVGLGLVGLRAFGVI